MWFLILVVVVLAALAYVRLAPTDVAKEHRPVDASEDADGEGYCTRVIAADEGALARIDAAAMEWPRTTRLAGSVEEGHVTYITRSKLVGFPDYTTVQREAGTIKIHARLRFGKSDFGVNRARVAHLVDAATG